jgi:hypothetical protein
MDRLFTEQRDKIVEWLEKQVANGELDDEKLELLQCQIDRCPDEDFRDQLYEILDEGARLGSWFGKIKRGK